MRWEDDHERPIDMEGRVSAIPSCSINFCKLTTGNPIYRYITSTERFTRGKQANKKTR
jgi:hypothetical protein